MRAVGIFLSIFFIGILFFAYRIFSPVHMNVPVMRFSVAPGLSSDQLANELAEKGIFRNSIDFSLIHFITPQIAKEGIYYFVEGMSEYEIYRALAAGPVRKEKIITIIEGWTLHDIAEYLSGQGFESPGVFIATATQDWSASHSFLQRAQGLSSLEGYLFPDTYRVYEDSSSRDIIGKMLLNFDKKFSSEMKHDIQNNGRTIHEVVTLASIIEREVPKDQDRVLVSDIFLRRLKKNMALQADSTVNYVTGKSSPQVSLSDTSIDSPYNTYKYRGLPPGPIGNPSLSSLRAAIYPQPNPYFYFLTGKDGRVHYSKTFEEHKKKKDMYL
ncbi:endolytic transglycosylase MltG [Candidatus Uhrbacteria bacterium]|nr:endolytic transglycosylase MltG [Candidatus Uhrbacteria bacterium]